MKINLFTLSDSDTVSAFELGGIEFFGDLENFSKSQYRSQDLQMIFISLVTFSFSMINKKSYTMSSKITFSYKEKIEGFFVNKILIEKISYKELLKLIHELIDNAINFLVNNGINYQDPILSDLFEEKKDLLEKINYYK